MSNIANVISWKFQSSDDVMETVNGVITKFPGGIPSQSDQDAWTAEYEAHRTVMSEIERLESQVTQRRQREAGPDDAGGTQTGRDWMSAQNALIATERAKL
tara:strand:- start:1381 stop:1683 length:303 start_codon:yes stop_codon:yes gene_type:complete